MMSQMLEQAHGKDFQLAVQGAFDEQHHFQMV